MQLGKALTNYLFLYADLSIDVPHLKEYLSKTIFYLLSDNCLFPCDLIFLNTEKKNEDGEIEMPLVEEYFSLVANILSLFYNKKFKNWKDVGKFY